MRGAANFVVGMQYGDEGKGKVVDLLSATHKVAVRANGGANAGHTILTESGTKLALHQLPSGVAYPDTLNVIGHGVFLDPVRLREELSEAYAQGMELTSRRLAISTLCHLVLPIHKARDAARESGEKGQGSTKSGIAFVASDKALREGIRAHVILRHDQAALESVAYDELAQYASNARTLAREFAEASLTMQPFLTDTVELLHQKLAEGENILVEGAQAFGLDIDHGKYPYTTSSITTVPGLLVGSGINHRHVGGVIGVVKATPSKVGEGAFVTKITDKAIAASTRGEKGQVDAEFGATTGREREVGYLDLVSLKRAVMVNGVDEIALTKFDCLNRHGDTTKIAVAYEYKDLMGNVTQMTVMPSSNSSLNRCTPIYETFKTWGDITGTDKFDDLPIDAKRYIRYIEEYLGVPVTLIGTGPGRHQTIIRREHSKVL